MVLMSKKIQLAAYLLIQAVQRKSIWNKTTARIDGDFCSGETSDGVDRLLFGPVSFMGISNDLVLFLK